MQYLSGTIWVSQVMNEAQRRQRVVAEWQARAKRSELRREESEVLRVWWRATETDRPEIVKQHQAVFIRIRANRRRAGQLERQERAISDAAMRQRGYVIRPDGAVPRYVRPERMHLYPETPVQPREVPLPARHRRAATGPTDPLPMFNRR